MDTETTQEARLLVLDDDSTVANTIGLAASVMNFDSRLASSAAEFFQLLDVWQPTHIALDLHMPAMDGIEVLRLLGQRQCDASIILTSGMEERILEAARRSGLAHGLNVSAVISKPFSLRQVRAALNSSGPPAAAGNHREVPPRFPITPLALEKAIQNNEFFLVYQPQILCSSKRPVGLEALVRWQQPDYGLIMPDEFIPLAEQTGLIEPLTELVFEKALQWFSSALRDQSLSLSLNLSARSLGDLALADRLETRCQDLAIDPGSIVIEITETSALEDLLTALDVLTRLRMKGFQLSLDDFGVGYSSMLQVSRLPFSCLKIDKRFVMEAAASAETRRLIRSIVHLGHTLGLSITAEGVETEELLGYLASIQCDSAQGFLIGRPMQAATVAGWLRAAGQSGAAAAPTVPPALAGGDLSTNHRLPELATGSACRNQRRAP